MKKLSALVLCLFVIGCNTAPPKDLLRPTEEALKTRNFQTRVYDTTDEKTILAASAGVLQDMGYSLDESETKLGLVVASKERKTENKGEKAFATGMAILGALSGSPNAHPYKGVEDKHKIKVALVSKPDTKRKKTAVRVTFQRLVWDGEGDLMRLETLKEQEMYTGFFAKLNKSVFLEGHTI